MKPSQSASCVCIKILSLCILSTFSTTFTRSLHILKFSLNSKNLIHKNQSIKSLSMSNMNDIAAPILISKESLATLFARYNTLSITKQRAVASVVGSAVADAATRPVHWLYNGSIQIREYYFSNC